MPQVIKIGAYVIYFGLDEGKPLEPILRTILIDKTISTEIRPRVSSPAYNAPSERQTHSKTRLGFQDRRSRFSTQRSIVRNNVSACRTNT